MLMEGNFSVKGKAEDLWELIVKPEVMVGCIPGCEKVEQISENKFNGIISARVSFINVRFKGTGELKNLNRPKSFEISGVGDDMTKLGSVRGNVIIELEEDGKGEVTISYKAKINIVGKLATMGDRIIRAKTKEVESEFTLALNNKLSGNLVDQPKLNSSFFEIFAILFGGWIDWFKNLRN
jgi:uncharacterized protein